MVGITMRGDKALFRKINRIADKKTQRRMLRPAVRKGANQIVKAWRKLAAKDTGGYRKALGVIVRANLKSNSIYAAIGPRMGVKTRKDGTKKYATWVKPKGQTVYNPAKIAHIVERGGKNRRIVKNWLGQEGVEKDVGIPKAQPSMHAAVNSSKGAVRMAMVAELRKQLQKEAMKK